MNGKCVVCHDKPSAFRCIQCHKPVCNDCAFKTEHGAFCSRDCAGAYRSYKQNAPKAARRGGGGKIVVFIILIVIALAFAWHYGVFQKLGLGAGG